MEMAKLQEFDGTCRPTTAENGNEPAAPVAAFPGDFVALMGAMLDKQSAGIQNDIDAQSAGMREDLATLEIQLGKALSEWIL